MFLSLQNIIFIEINFKKKSIILVALITTINDNLSLIRNLFLCFFLH